jgi:hypothetical protein
LNSNITAKDIILTTGSNLYFNPVYYNGGTTFNTDKFYVASGATFDVGRNLQNNGNLQNDGTISG